jgi:phosphoribosylformylglycinamidine cyclo-ligase
MVRVPAGMQQPALVMSTDGVGTKVLVAQQAGRYGTVGEDLVNHSVNDILVHGARPLAFMDYIAGAGLSEDVLAEIVEGVARGCRNHDMALAGGETAQMPGLYQPGHFDLAGTIIGVVEEAEALHGDRIVEGDLLLGYASTGLHTNGYTLARHILFETAGLRLDDAVPGTGTSVADALLAVHRSYASALMPVLPVVHGIAHITGGGIAGNLVRILPSGCAAVVDPASWPMPPLFAYLQQAGRVSTEEMRDVFNLGIGLVVALPCDVEADVRAAAEIAGVPTWRIGHVESGVPSVRFAD